MRNPNYFTVTAQHKCTDVALLVTERGEEGGRGEDRRWEGGKRWGRGGKRKRGHKRWGEEEDDREEKKW